MTLERETALQTIYKNQLEHRIPKVRKFELTKNLAQVIAQMQADGRSEELDHLQVALWELLLLQDRSNRLSAKLIEKLETPVVPQELIDDLYKFLLNSKFEQQTTRQTNQENRTTTTKLCKGGDVRRETIEFDYNERGVMLDRLNTYKSKHKGLAFWTNSTDDLSEDEDTEENND